MTDTSGLTTVDQGTASAGITPAPTLPETGLPSVSQLREHAGVLDTQASLLRADTSELHGDLVMREWGVKTTELVRLDVPQLLAELADLGFAWRSIAQLIGVSVPAVQKWRRGGSVSGESRTNTAAVVAACRLIEESYVVFGLARWFECPILPGVPVTPLDLYISKKINLVFLLASGKTDPVQVLDVFDPDWRDTYRSEFEVFQADDGVALRRREQ